MAELLQAQKASLPYSFYYLYHTHNELSFLKTLGTTRAWDTDAKSLSAITWAYGTTGHHPYK